MSSTQESKTCGGYINYKEKLPIHQTTIEMGHPQGPTPLKFDNKCVHGIITGVLKQKQSKGMDMRFYCLCDIFTEQKQFHTHWKRSEHNLGDHPTKNHLDKHHRTA